MKYFSTNNPHLTASLREAVINGLAPDRGLYMPESIRPLSSDFYADIHQLSFHDIAFEVAKAFFGDDIPAEDLRQITADTLSFDVPLVKVANGIFSLELFHGPTLAFKDVGARFMARMLEYFIAHPVQEHQAPRGDVNVLVATSGDTGSAVANGFLGVKGIHVFVLYPKGKVSPIQECQFTTLGRNITAVEVDGVFDDCQRLVKQAFLDADLRHHLSMTSANSINVARLLPQAFYYFYAYAQLRRQQLAGKAPQGAPVISVPSGNFGNLTAGLFAHRMGLPVARFVAANNANDIFYHYLRTGDYSPKASIPTLANAMDVGDPSNFARILALYGSAHKAICKDIAGATYTDDDISTTMRRCHESTGYVLDPHGACAYEALLNHVGPAQPGIFLETAHPAKFKEKVDTILGTDISLPPRLAAFMKGVKHSEPMSSDFADFKAFLLSR